MPTILWWVLGSIGVGLLLLFCYHTFRLLRLQSIIVEFLAFQDINVALRHISEHPQLLSDDAEELIRDLLDRALTRRGDAGTFVSGIIHMTLLMGCREQGVETARRTMADSLQAWLDDIRSPAWQRALAILGRIVTAKKPSIPLEEVDEELVEAMSQIMTLLAPLADEETVTIQDRLLRELRHVVQQKAEGTLQP